MSVGVDCGENRRSGVNNGVQRGAVAPPDAAGEGRKIPSPEYFMTNEHKSEYDKI